MAEIDPLNDQLPCRLGKRLRHPLPGRAAQRRFSPPLAYGRHFGPPAQDARAAAVLVLLYPHRDRWKLPLTLRPDHLADHAGQISFPGGAMEEGESPEACAVREYEEELGAGGDSLVHLGRLTPLYVFGSNFLVFPIVAVAGQRPEFVPNPAEVAELLELDLEVLSGLNSRTMEPMRRRGIDYRCPCICCAEHRIWGATSMMLGEFSRVLEDLAQRPLARARSRG
jgi:8-oxo-dGTP pyrophosphatase MutT (NUDIX family)